MGADVKQGLAGPIERSLWRGPQWLGEIAPIDPRLAYTLLRVPGLVGPNGCLNEAGGWEIINLVGRFESGAAGTTVEAKLQNFLNTDLWIRRVTYTVRRPNAFSGNILKAQSDYFNKLNPNIDFTLLIDSYCRILVSPGPTPLENIETVFECICPAGIVLRCSAGLLATFTLNRNLAPDEIPTEAIISLHGTVLPNGIYGACDNAFAIAALREWGAWIPPGNPPCP